MAEDKSEWGVPQNAATVRAALLCREHTSPFQPAALSAACHYLAVHHGLPSSKKKKSDSFIYSTLLDFAAWPDKDMVIFLHFAAHEVPALSIEAKCSLHLRVEWKAPIPPCSMKQNTLGWYSIVPYPTRSIPGKPEHINSLTADPPMTDKPGNIPISLRHFKFWYKKLCLPSAYTCWRGTFLPQMCQLNPAPVSGHGHWLCDFLKGK